MAYLETQLSFTLVDGALRRIPFRPIAAAASLACTGAILAFLAQAAAMFRLPLGVLAAEALASTSLAYVVSFTAGAIISAVAPAAAPDDAITGPRRTALAAVWLAPAVMLAAHSSPAAPLAAVIAVVAATRCISEESLDETASRTSQASIRGVLERVPEPGLIFPVAAAAMAQGAVAAILLQNVAGAFVLLPLGAAALTSLFVARRLPNAGERAAARYSARRAISGVLAASALTAAGLIATFGNAEPQTQAGRKSAGLPAKLLRTFSSTTAGSATARSAEAQADHLPVAVGTGDYPGVVLWPEIRAVTLLVAPLPYRPGGWTGAPRAYGIPFGGEYWMYRPPSSRPPAGSYFRRGSPTTQAFHTTDGRPLAMEARQRLEQSLDLRCCSAIQVELSNAEPNAGAVSVELMVRDRRQAGTPWGSLGQRDISSGAGPKGRPVVESITFAVPADPTPRYFDEFRVVFHRGPEAADKSARIAIQRFVLLPR